MGPSPVPVQEGIGARFLQSLRIISEEKSYSYTGTQSAEDGSKALTTALAPLWADGGI